GPAPDPGVVGGNPANERALRGIRTLSRKWGLGKYTAETMKIEAPAGVTRLSPKDRQRMTDLLAGLHSPKDDIFPLRFARPSPVECAWLIDHCPAVVHPETGVIFGVRVGTYLSLLRLSGKARAAALAAGAAWTKFPIPGPVGDVDLTALFGEEWVIPNLAHP